MPLFDFVALPGRPVCQRVLEDRWNSNPPQVTSFLSFPRSKVPSTESKVTYDSPNCGFGWQFQLAESFRPHILTPVSGLVGQLDISFKPPLLFSSLPLSNVAISVKVTYPTSLSPLTHEKTFNSISLKMQCELGSYEEPAQYTGSTVIAITITFSALDGLSLPTSPSVDFKAALCQSFDDPGFIDTKFYLYSAKQRRVPARPKAVFAKSTLLVESSSYLQNLLSSETGFKNGTPCDLQGEVSEELTQLSADAYDYDSDSDLESIPDHDDEDVPQGGDHSLTADETGKETEKSLTLSPDGPHSVATNENDRKSLGFFGILRGRAFAINGTAYQTWKAFMFYTYTNNVHFNHLKSQHYEDDTLPTSTVVSCSPKSMYRFADYADLPALRALAKEGIRKGLSKSNVVTELFSTFTYKYQEIIEMEVDFLLKEFTPKMGRELDEMLQLVVVGAKPHCYRVLAFIIRRQRGESSQDAWRILDGGELELSSSSHATPRPHSPTPRTPRTRPPTPRAPHLVHIQPIGSSQPTQQPAAPVPTSPRPQASRPPPAFTFNQPLAFQPLAAHQAVPRSSLFFTPSQHRRPTGS